MNLLFNKLLTHWLYSPRLERFLLPALVIIIFCIIISLLVFRKHPTKTNFTLSPEAARALELIFTPTSGGWSSNLASYFRRTNTQSAVQLDLHELLENIFVGNIELRDVGDLADLLRGSLCVSHIPITLSVTPSLWFAAARCIITQQLHLSSVCYFTSFYDRV